VFIFVQGVLILLGAINWRPWSKLGPLSNVVEFYSTITRTVDHYRFFTPPIAPQPFVKVESAGPPAFDDIVGRNLSQEAALRMVKNEEAFADDRNIPLLLEFVSRQFFERHPEYKIVVITFGYYKVPSRNAWMRGERVSMQKSLDMTFQRSD
jgi:hypothetical protein